MDDRKREGGRKAGRLWKVAAVMDNAIQPRTLILILHQYGYTHEEMAEWLDDNLKMRPQWWEQKDEVMAFLAQYGEEKFQFFPQEVDFTVPYKGASTYCIPNTAFNRS